MPVIRCPSCQTRYDVGPEAAGQRSQCRKCGQIFRIPPLPSSSAPPATPSPPTPAGDDLIELEGLTRPAPAPTSDSSEPALAIPLTATVAYATGQTAREIVAARTAYPDYLRSLARSLSFPARLGNLITLLIVWIILVVGEFAGITFTCIGAAAWLIVESWYMAFQLNVVAAAAAGEEDVPALTLTEGWWEGVFLPFLRMSATLLVCYAPLCIFLGSVAPSLTGLTLVGVLTGGISPLVTVLGVRDAIIAGVLLLGGFFVWPMLVLVVALGSTACLLQVGRVVLTMVRSLPAYLLTVLAVYLSLGLDYGIRTWTDTLVTPTSGGQRFLLVSLLRPLALLVELYFQVIAMRAIGFYYFHFKHKFAWTWG